MRTTILGLLLVMVAFTSMAANPIPSNRLPIWKGNVGVPGGIPNRTTIYTTIPAGASAATINSAIAACPSDQVVLLSAGNYTITSTINLKSGVTLRGAGKGVTILNGSIGTVILARGTWANDFGSPVTANHISWVSNYNQGTKTLGLSSTSLSGSAESIPVGNLVMIDRLSTTNDNAAGGYGLQPVWWSIANPTTGADRYQHQISYVTAKSGHTITIDPPILQDNYGQSGALPQVWYLAGAPIQGVGVESLTIRNTGGNNSATGCRFEYAYGCWAYDVQESNFRYGFNPYMAVRCEWRRCTAGGKSGSGDDYIFSLYYLGGCWFEDNSIEDIQTSAFLLESVSGSAFSYNYTTNFNSTTGGNMNTGCLNSHGGNNAMNLLEGNNFDQVSLDNGWGSAFGFVFLRNRISGWAEEGSGYGNYVAAIVQCSMNRFNSIVGNVLGTATKNTVYEFTGTGANLVYSSQLSLGNLSPSPDPVVVSSMVRAMNWDSATTSNGGLVSGGFTSADVPVSLLYDSKPSFFGNLTWPPIDPTNVAYSISRTNIPAGYRFVYGIAPPGGSVNQPPVASASASVLAALPLTPISFSSSGSFDPEGTALSYSWNFGDGATSTAANPSHSFASNGAYTVRLTVSDGVNSTSATPLTITINSSLNQPPTAVGAATSSSGAAPLAVAFSSAGSSDPEGAALTYSWNFGDGTTSTAANPNHTYSIAGDYSAQLTVSDGTNTTTSSAIAITATGLLAAYGFEETSGTTAIDAAANRSSGTITTATRVAGKYGFGLAFNGTDSVVSISNSMASPSSSKMTIEAWVKPATADNQWRPVLGKSYNGLEVSYVLQGATPQNGVPAFYVAPSPGNLLGLTPLPTNTWSHVAATADGTTTRLYVNGSLVTSQAQSGAPSRSNDPLTIGSDGLQQAFWSGDIDEVRVYNRALSASEIQTDMNTPVVAQVSVLPPQNLRLVSQ